MFKNILESIDGIAIWPIIGLILFFVFFIVMLVFVIRNDKEHDEYMSKLPLDQ